MSLIETLELTSTLLFHTQMDSTSNNCHQLQTCDCCCSMIEYTILLNTNHEGR